MPILKIAEREMFYDLTGPAQAPVIVFSNSLGATIEMWDGVVRVLAPFYRCLRYDTRGHGRSLVRPGAATIGDFADDLVALLDALAIDRAHIVGLSMGGMIAQSVAGRYPGRVDHVALLATAPSLPPPENWLARAQTVRAEGIGAIVDATMQRWFSTGADPALVAASAAQFAKIDREGYAIACEAIARLDLHANLAAIKAPTLVVAASFDPVTTVAMGREMAASISNARFAEIDQAAHLFAIERPVETAALLREFLPSAPCAEDFAFAAGLANRKAVLGVDHVQRSLDKAGAFGQPWQEFITRIAWGETWGDATLPFKTRSLLTLAMMIALGREAEFKLHLRPALKNGVTPAELRALLMHAAVYAGVPAVNGAFAAVREELGDLG
jgi:3-oxoadipate enol-lactonase / 4-carboxymuconolactone decarboxylase